MKIPLSPDLRLLVACCRSEADFDEIRSLIENWDTIAHPLSSIVGLAARHGVLPPVYKTLKKLSDESFPGERGMGKRKEEKTPNKITSENGPTTNDYKLTTEIMPAFKQQYHAIAQRNMLMSAELIRIMKLLEGNGIEALAFKGPVLSQMAYGDITMRQYSDLDILVDEKEIFKAGTVLSEHGYNPSFPIKILKNKTCLSSTNDLAFYNQSNGILVELHWKLFREKIGQHLHFSMISEHKQLVNINGKEIPSLSTEMLLAYLCLHGSKHAWERIEWICDIDRLVRSEAGLDWDKTEETAKEMDTLTTLYLGLALSHLLFHTPLPEKIVASMQTERIDDLVSKTFELLRDALIENEGYAKYSTIHMYQMDLLDTKLKKLHHLFTTYFGISRNDCQEFFLPPSLKFLYIFIKPFRVLSKYIQYGK